MKRTLRDRLGGAANRLLRPVGAELRSTRTEIWSRDAEFVAARERVRPLTMMGPERMFVLWQLARQAALLEMADTAEVGVWRGGASALVAALDPRRHHWALDTFEGLPEADADRLAAGAFAAPVDEVRRSLAGHTNIEVIAGLFPDSAGPLTSRRFSFVHLDMDLHAGTHAGLELFWPRLVAGGTIVVDDYGSQHEGVTRAVDDFARARGRERPLVFATGQCALIKAPGA
jgi:hypothetical protein